MTEKIAITGVGSDEDLIIKAFDKKGALNAKVGTCYARKSGPASFYIETWNASPRKKVLEGIFTIRSAPSPNKKIEIEFDKPDYVEYLDKHCSAERSGTYAKKLLEMPKGEMIKAKRLIEKFTEEIVSDDDNDACADWCLKAIGDDYNEWCSD